MTHSHRVSRGGGLLTHNMPTLSSKGNADARSFTEANAHWLLFTENKGTSITEQMCPNAAGGRSEPGAHLLTVNYKGLTGAQSLCIL